MRSGSAHSNPAPEPGQPHGPITVILNIGSGADEKARIRQQIVDTLAASGRASSLIEVTPADDLSGIAEQVAARARQSGGVVVAAGGDGTVNTVAAACGKHGAILGVIPLGTFNYFARALTIPDQPDAAARILFSGKIAAVGAGFVNGHLFLNNASFGLYTRIIRQREQAKSRFGRFQLVALLSAAVTLLRGQRPFVIKLVVDGIEQIRRTAMVFIGNNSLQLNQLNLPIAQCAKEDRLAVVMLKPTTRSAMAALMLRGAFKGLSDDKRLEMFCADRFEVESIRQEIDVVVDGELIRCHTPLAFHVERAALKVMVPAQEPVHEAAGDGPPVFLGSE